jgi:site-specific recombinase XerD
LPSAAKVLLWIGVTPFVTQQPFQRRTQMTALRAEMIKQMQLERLAPKTQEAYLNAVKGLAAFYRQSPDRLTPRQVQDYLHHLLVERKLAWSSCNVAVNAFVYLYTRVLKWDRLKLALPPCKRESRLPEVLSTEQVEQLLSAPGNPKHRVLLMTTYAAGLRVSEVVNLQVADIDSDRMSIRVRQGKGRKDRYSMLSDRLLAELRAYWTLYRPRTWLFPGPDRSRPLRITTAQRIYNAAKRGAGIERGRGIHTLRHCFATHLLEAGVDPRTLQLLLGHKSLNTTMRYLQVTRRHVLNVRSPLDLLPVPEPSSPR